MKPCIVVKDKAYSVYEAYNEHARVIIRRNSWSALVNDLESCGYEIVSNNTRFAKTILDKINQHHI